MSRSPLRVLLIAPGYAPTIGGVETHVTGLARALAADGVSVQVWAPDRTCRAPRDERDGSVRVRRFPSTASTRFPLAPRLYAHARSGVSDHDVVHVHGYHSAAAAAVLLARGSVPYVFTPHYHGGGHTRLAALAHVAYRPIGGALFTHAAAVIAVSGAEAALIRRDRPGTRPVLIHNGVDAASIAAAAPIAGQPPTLLVLGRLEPYKRVEIVLDAFDRTDAAGQLVVVGDGPDRARLAALARAGRRAGDVHFTGPVSRAAVDAWLRTARGVVSMSAREAFGLVALESAAAGGVSVLSDIPAHRDVAALAGQGAVTLCAPDAEALAEHLDHVLGLPAGSPRPVRDWSTVADEHLRLYRSVLAHSPVALDVRTP